jgi:hypothetical protein
MGLASSVPPPAEGLPTVQAAVATLLTLALAANAAPPAARWNPKAPENAQMLPAFSFATLEPVLGAIGARYQRSGSAAKPELLVSFANNRKAILVLSACSEGGCKGLSIQSYWTSIANSPAERAAQAIGDFNQRYAFAKAYIASDGRPALQRYLTADYGFVRGNLAVNLLVLARQADQFATEVLRPLEAKR